MSINLTNCRAKLNEILGDVVSGTTSEDGADTKKTFVDISLAKYPDHYFAGRVAYLPVAAESRDVEDFLQPEGVVMVHSAFTAKVLATVAYELHKHHPDKKKIAINQALLAAYPYLYKRLEDVSLTGTGSGVTEYDVPAAFTDGFPLQIWLKSTSGTKISFEEFLDADYKEVAGAKKFYADIATTYTILLLGRTWLTPFTNDASTTELTDEQAHIVCLKAAANLYRMGSAVVNAEDSSRFDSLASIYDSEFDKLLSLKRMPSLYQMRIKEL